MEPRRTHDVSISSSPDLDVIDPEISIKSLGGMNEEQELVSIQSEQPEEISLNDSVLSALSCHNYASQKPPETPTKSKLRKKVKRLREQLRHKDKKIKHLQDIVGNMKKRNMVSDSFSDLLAENFSGLPLELFKHEKANVGQAKNRLTYSEEIRKMAVTLHFYSPRGYKYMRSILTLPHPRTLRNWKSSVDNEPGFFLDVFKVKYFFTNFLLY